jgi:acyl carrier protein
MTLDTIKFKMSFNEFKAMLAEVLAVNPTKLVPEAYFITDLAVDSIRMVELLLRMQETRLSIPPEAAWEIQTVGDAYDYYLKYVSS